MGIVMYGAGFTFERPQAWPPQLHDIWTNDTDQWVCFAVGNDDDDHDQETLLRCIGGEGYTTNAAELLMSYPDIRLDNCGCSQGGERPHADQPPETRD